jgi:hypothetical protein
MVDMTRVDASRSSAPCPARSSERLGADRIPSDLFVEGMLKSMMRHSPWRALLL